MLSSCSCIKYIVLKSKNILYWTNIYQFIHLKFYNIRSCKCNRMKKRVYYIIYNICSTSIFKKNLRNKVNKNKIEKKILNRKQNTIIILFLLRVALYYWNIIHIYKIKIKLYFLNKDLFRCNALDSPHYFLQK